MSNTGQTQTDEPAGSTESVSADDGTLVQEEIELERSSELSRRGEEAPASIPGYEILHCLGEGAYGSVWLAREKNTGRQVAIKFYTHRRGLDWSLLNREVEKLAVLYTSRNIVRLLEVGWDSDPPYYVMEYLQNGSLASFLAEGPLPPQEAVRIAKSVLQALIHAHGSGILHCDLKPANVLLDAGFEPRICDFGQSRLSDEQQPALGTLFYMAPEQADLDAVPDARWDVYALGALLYQMLCGEAPYRTPENEQRISETETLKERLVVYREILETQPVPSGHRKMRKVDKRLADIVDRCLQFDPQKRFPNAQAVLDQLEARDRQRSRRPLVALGVVVPALLLAFMTPLARNAMQDAVVTAGDNLTRRALESDVLSARILAKSLARDLEDRKHELVEISKDPELRRELLENTPRLPEITKEEKKELTPEEERKKERERIEMFASLEKLNEDGQEYRENLGLSLDTSWFYTDQNGIQRWRKPYDLKTIDKDYSFREYFTGIPEGTDLESAQPITEPHISHPFRSQATGRFMVAISVPVFDPDDESKVIGVLARTTHLGELLDNYGQSIRGGDRESGEDINRVVALVERSDWKLLDHPWMTEQQLKDLPEEVFLKLTVDPRIVETLKSSTNGNGSPVDNWFYHANYIDPVAQVETPPAGSNKRFDGEWLAAFSPVGDTGWTVIVQERRPAALEPVRAMRIGLVESGLWALVVFLGLIILAWTFVLYGER